MEESSKQESASRVLQQLGIVTVSAAWTGCDPVWPAFETMAGEGAVVVVKVDGQRGNGDSGRYTVIVSGGPLGEDFFRTDTPVLEDGLAGAILHYAERVWNKRG